MTAIHFMSFEMSRKRNGKGSTREGLPLHPQTVIIRIMRRLLPERAQVSEESKYLVQAMLTEFIGFVNAEYGYVYHSHLQGSRSSGSCESS